MLTPRFKLSQDENHIFMTIHAPYTNIGDTEIDVDGESFLFVSSPYFLRLLLPGRIVENEKSKGTYLSDSGEFKLEFDKDIPGEYFENLDMITSLLKPKDIPNINPNLVEMLEEDGVIIDSTVSEYQTFENQYRYGFANKITSEFHDIGSEFPQIFDLKVPEEVAVEDRHELRKKHEVEKFCPDHYLADLFEVELLEPYINSEIYWAAPNFDSNADFTADEIGILKELPNKHYLLTEIEAKQVLLGLVDILFGYCYDKCTTLNDSNVESSWTINKLSATLSWFCVFNNIKEVLTACYRRALCYPIYRNFDLCNKTKCDLITLLKNGKKFVIKCLLEIHTMFNTSNDARYILNQLYIQDYLVYIQNCNTDAIVNLCYEVSNVNVEKSDLELDIVELEHAAKLVQEEADDFEVTGRFAQITLKNRGDSDSDEDSDSSSRASSDESSSLESSDLDSDDDPS